MTLLWINNFYCCCCNVKRSCKFKTWHSEISRCSCCSTYDYIMTLTLIIVRVCYFYQLFCKLNIEFFGQIISVGLKSLLSTYLSHTESHWSLGDTGKCSQKCKLPPYRFLRCSTETRSSLEEADRETVSQSHVIQLFRTQAFSIIRT